MGFMSTHTTAPLLTNFSGNTECVIMISILTKIIVIIS